LNLGIARLFTIGSLFLAVPLCGMRIIDDVLRPLVVPAGNWPEGIGIVITRATRAIERDSNISRQQRYR